MRRRRRQLCFSLPWVTEVAHGDRASQEPFSYPHVATGYPKTLEPTSNQQAALAPSLWNGDWQRGHHLEKESCKGSGGRWEGLSPRCEWTLTTMPTGPSSHVWFQEDLTTISEPVFHSCLFILFKQFGFLFICCDITVRVGGCIKGYLPHNVRLMTSQY